MRGIRTVVYKMALESPKNKVKWTFQVQKEISMYKRLLQRPLDSNQSFFLFGPRGTGKTSWLKENVPEGPRRGHLIASKAIGIACRCF